MNTLNLNEIADKTTNFDHYKKSAVLHETTENKEIFIFHDKEPTSPREDYKESCLGIILYSSNSYTLGDINIKRFENNNVLNQYVEILIKLPVYAYIHSGVTISTSPFSCRYDSGQSGEIFTTKAKIRKWYGVKRITKALQEKALKQLQNEIESFDKYLSGSVYGFKTFDKATGEEIDSCWGIYDSPTEIVKGVTSGAY